MTNLTGFAGTPGSAVLLQPFWNSVHPGKRGKGIPLGPDIVTREMLRCDPWDWRLAVDGALDSPVFHFYGARGSGKSTAMKVLVARLMMLSAGKLKNEAQRMKVRIHSEKPEDGEAEYAPLARALGCTPLPLTALRINMFDPEMGMNPWDLLETAFNVCEMVMGRPLTGLEPLAIQIAMFRMLQDHTAIMPELLERILWTLSAQDINDYYHSSNAALQQVADTSERSDLQHHLQEVLERSHNVQQDELQRAALQMGSCFTQLLRGDYGQIFGGAGSLRGRLEEPALLLDWNGVNDKARTLLQALLWKWQTEALRKNDLRIVPNIDVGDEMHQAMTNLMYLRFMVAYTKMARAFPTLIMRATQFPTDYNAIGDQDSERRNLALSVRQGAGAEFIGNQPNREEILDYWRGRGISAPNIQFLTMAPTGYMGLKMPDRPVIFFRLKLTPLELELVQSDAASRHMVNREAFEGPSAEFERLLRSSAGA